MIEEYIEKKSIYVGIFYYPCNIVKCEVKDAILSYEGNNYCMKHFLEIIKDDIEAILK